MARAIDADEFRESLIHCKGLGRHSLIAVLEHLEKQPTIEAEPVKQEWKPIKGFEGLYEVNRYGQIRNANGKLMRQQLKHAKHTSYKKVNLYKNGKYTYKMESKQPRSVSSTIRTIHKLYFLERHGLCT